MKLITDYWTEEEIKYAQSLMLWLDENADQFTADVFREGIPQTPADPTHLTFAAWMKDHTGYKMFGRHKQ